MHIKLAINKIYIRLFAILNVLGLIACFIDIRLGIVSAILIALMFFSRLNLKLLFSDKAFVIFLIANVLSVVAYIWNERPISVFVAAISFNFIPSLLYYIGLYIGSKHEEEQLCYKMLDSFIFMMLVGTIAYLAFPSFYYNYLGQSIESYTYGINEYRYGSYISSIALGAVGSVGTVLYFYLFNKLKAWKKILYIPLIILNVIMCMQRSAWIVTFVALVICLLLRFGSDRKSRIRVIGLVAVFVVFVAIVWTFRSSIFTQIQLSYFERRIGTVNALDMINSRSSQWSSAWKTFMNNPILGFGLGSCGQKAAPYGMAVVTDGNHLRILAEIGFVGFGAFVYMNIRAVYRAIRSNKCYLAIVIILSNIAAFGSPIFDQYYASFAYWLILGCATCTFSVAEAQVKGL